MESWREQVWLAAKLFAAMWIGHWIYTGQFLWVYGLVALAIAGPVYLVAGAYHLVWGDRSQESKETVKTAVLTTAIRAVVGVGYVIGFIYLALAGGDRP